MRSGKSKISHFVAVDVFVVVVVVFAFVVVVPLPRVFDDSLALPETGLLVFYD